MIKEAASTKADSGQSACFDAQFQVRAEAQSSRGIFGLRRLRSFYEALEEVRGGRGGDDCSVRGTDTSQ